MPILWATGTGSDVMKRIGAPLIGGVLTSFLLELLVYPAIYEAWKWRELKRDSESVETTGLASRFQEPDGLPWIDAFPTPDHTGVVKERVIGLKGHVQPVNHSG